MAINQYEPLKLNQTNRYAGYQFHAKVRLDGMEPSDAFRFLILSVCSWARKRMPESDRNVPELSLPEAEEYASVGPERFMSYHFSVGYALDITPLMDSGIWALRLKEPDSGIKGERDAVPGRFFTTRVGLRLNDKGYTELGIRIDITDPASVEKEIAFAFRPSFVRTLAIQSFVHFEDIRELKHGLSGQIETDEDYKQFLNMLENEDNQLPLVVFTHFRPGEKKAVPQMSLEDFVKNDQARSFLEFSGVRMSGMGVSPMGSAEKKLEFQMPVMPGAASPKKPVKPAMVQKTSSGVSPAPVIPVAPVPASVEPPVMPFNADAFGRSAFAYARVYVLGDRYLEKFRTKVKKEFSPGDILVCGARKFRGGISIVPWPGDQEEDQKKAYADALLLAQCWSKHKSPYSFGSVVFEAEARKMEQHARVMELVNSSSMEDKDKIGQLKYEMELLFGVIDDKDRDIEQLKRQKDEAFSRGVDFGENGKATLEEENAGLRKELVNKQDQIAQMEGRYQEAKGVLGVLDELRAVSAMPESKEDVVQYFRKVYRDRIDFTERGLSTAAKCDLKPASLWTVLYAVANGLVDLFRNSSGNCSEKDVQECTGYRVSFGEGSMTREIADMMRLREDIYEGKVISVEPHLKLRNGKEEKENQRLHFWYDKDRRRIVIGYLGKHLDSVSGRRKS